MANPDRILERMRRVPPDMSLADLITLIDSLDGWEWRQKNHLVIHSPKGKSFTIGTVKGRYVKQVNIRMLLKELDIE